LMSALVERVIPIPLAVSYFLVSWSVGESLS